jgi:hypothetical protein
MEREREKKKIDNVLLAEKFAFIPRSAGNVVDRFQCNAEQITHIVCFSDNDEIMKKLMPADPLGTAHTGTALPPSRNRLLSYCCLYRFGTEGTFIPMTSLSLCVCDEF